MLTKKDNYLSKRYKKVYTIQHFILGLKNGSDRIVMKLFGKIFLRFKYYLCTYYRISKNYYRERKAYQRNQDEKSLSTIDQKDKLSA